MGKLELMLGHMLDFFDFIHNQEEQRYESYDRDTDPSQHIST